MCGQLPSGLSHGGKDHLSPAILQHSMVPRMGGFSLNMKSRTQRARLTLKMLPSALNLGVQGRAQGDAGRSCHCEASPASETAGRRDIPCRMC